MDEASDRATGFRQRVYDLSDELFKKFGDLLEGTTGIKLQQCKKYLIVHRLEKIVGDTMRYPDLQAFYDALTGPSAAELMPKFINAMTTNYSYFFREPVHFAALREYLDGRGRAEDRVRLWSAAASTGEEAYSMAITTMGSSCARHPDLRILATDISGTVLEFAGRGVFPAEHVLKGVRSEDIGRWFKPVSDGKEFEVSASLRAMIAFRYMNLLEPFPFKHPMDIVFLRNVLIYFGKEGKDRVIDRVWNCLKPGGLLVVGLTESLIGVPHHFITEKNSIYRKP